MTGIILLLFIMSVVSIVLFFYYTIKYTEGIRDESIKSPVVAIYYDRMCLLGIVIIILIILIGALL